MKRFPVVPYLLAIVAVLSVARAASAQLIVRDRQYRCSDRDAVCKDRPGSLPAFEDQGRFTINYVEVRDDGLFWDGRQLEDAVEQIDKARAGGTKRPIVFVYIHGWQNNADEIANAPGETDCLKLRGDVAKFRTCGAARLASHPFAGSTRPVVGIYLAWRGLSSTIEPFKHLISYWPRRNKARLVGRRGMFDALDAIVKKVGEHRDDYTLLVIGHSFGARVLEYAADAVDPGRNHCGFMERFRRQFDANDPEECPPDPTGPPSGSVSKPPVDLFVYVNAATTHRMTFKALHDWKRVCEGSPTVPGCDAAPMYLATSSRTDYATAFLLPVSDAILPALKADRYHLIAAANTPWLHTHHDPRKMKHGCPVHGQDEFCFEDPPSGNRTEPVVYYTKVHGDNDQRRFWIFNTGHRLIRNHGDVWNERIFNMVLAVLDRKIAAGN